MNISNSIHQKNCIFCEVRFNNILFSTPNFIVAFDNFPLTEGHLLLFSKNHFGCGGEVYSPYFDEMIELKDKISNLLSTTYGKALFYEHGRAGHCVSFNPDERLCHHFHLHAIPINSDIHKALDNRFQKIDIKSYQFIYDFFNRFGEYLYVENNKESYFYPVSTTIEPHLLRTLVAKTLNVPERADWENFNDKDFINSAIANANAQLKNKLLA